MTAHLVIGITPDSLSISLTNPTNSRAVNPARSGFGLIGMRERVTALGGTINSATHEGLFRLSVEIPLGPEDVS